MVAWQLGLRVPPAGAVPHSTPSFSAGLPASWRPQAGHTGRGEGAAPPWVFIKGNARPGRVGPMMWHPALVWASQGWSENDDHSLLLPGQ